MSSNVSGDSSLCSYSDRADPLPPFLHHCLSSSVMMQVQGVNWEVCMWLFMCVTG